MYIPDRTIERRLKAYDNKLSVKWIPRKERWGIYRDVPSENGLYDRQVLVKLVRNADDSYRPLDVRVIKELREADNHRLSRMNYLHKMRELEEANEKRTAQIERDSLNEIEDISKDIAPTASREMADDVGSRNIPKEDVVADLEERYGKEKAEEILT